MLKVPLHSLDLTKVVGYPSVMAFLQDGATLKARHPSLQAGFNKPRTVLTFITGFADKVGAPIRFTLSVVDINLGTNRRVYLDDVETVRDFVDTQDESARYSKAVDFISQCEANCPASIHRRPVDPVRLVPLPPGVSQSIM